MGLVLQIRAIITNWGTKITPFFGKIPRQSYLKHLYFIYLLNNPGYFYKNVICNPLLLIITRPHLLQLKIIGNFFSLYLDLIKWLRLQSNALWMNQNPAMFHNPNFLGPWVIRFFYNHLNFSSQPKVAKKKMLILGSTLLRSC